MGPDYGDAPSVGYELLYSQVTRAQGLFSPRTVNVQFSLEYIAENLDVPTVVLQYPSKAEVIEELKKGYDYVGISFLMALMHRMKELVELIREHAPQTKIVLGGYGTILSDEELKPYADYICREEGVAYFRRILGEPEISMPYKHPLIVSWLKVFGMRVSGTGKIFAGLGCPNGCDFCCTSHFFDRKHVRLLPSGRDIYAVAERYLDLDPRLVLLIIDEDFLLNKKRAMEFRDCVIKGGRTLSIFCFSSIKAISQYTVEEILEMGIDGFWIGYEGTRSGYAKQQGRPVEDILTEFREHGITILTSMIVGFDYQDKEVVAKELDGLMKLKPSLGQYLIYGPVPGTPFFKRVMKEGTLRDEYKEDWDKFYKRADGFATMMKHPKLSAAEVEDLQRWCFEQDFERLGPTLFRTIEAWLLGRQKLKNSPNPMLRKKADFYGLELRKSYPIFLAGRLLGPNPTIRRWIGELQRRVEEEMGSATLKERAMSVMAVGAALWTAFTLKFKLFQHPKLIRTTYRMPAPEWKGFHLWESLPSKFSLPDLSVRVDLQHARKQVWVRLEGAISRAHAEGLAEKIRESLDKTQNRIVLDLKRLQMTHANDLKAILEKLSDYRSRIQLVLPKVAATHPELMLVASLFHHYKG